MSDVENPFSYGVRQAIRQAKSDSGKTIYRIGEESKVSCRNLYRFVAGTRRLSQESFDSLGLLLKLSLTLDYDHLRPVHLRHYISLKGPRSSVDLQKQINEPADTPMSVRIRRTVEFHRKSVSEIAEELRVTETHLYRFLDGSGGLSQDKLDTLCAFLGLFVEGPPVFVPPRRKGAMSRSERRIYRPVSAQEPPGQAKSKGQHTPPSRAPSIFPPPEDDSYDEA